MPRVARTVSSHWTIRGCPVQPVPVQVPFSGVAREPVDTSQLRLSLASLTTCSP